MDGYVVSNSDVLYHTLFESFSDAGAVSCQGLYAGWFALSFPAVVRAGIWTFARVPAIAHLLFTKDDVGYLTSSSTN